VNLPGPLATSCLAEFGASVTKVEPRPVIRRLPPPRKGDWFRWKQRCARLWGCAHGCAPRSPFWHDRRKYSGAKLHRRKLIRWP